MLARYTRAAMGEIWSSIRKFQNWVRIEAASLRAQTKLGMIPVSVPDDLENRIVIDPAEIDRIEEKTGHDVVAFLEHTNPQLPAELRPYWHRKMTSMDPQETGLSLQMVESVNLILHDFVRLMQTLRRRAYEFKHTPMIGRTHGVHAEPITFGTKLALWYDELKRHQDRLIQARERVAVGKLSGAVGMYTLPPEVERLVCQELGLRPIMTSQVIGRDIVAEYITVLALVASTVEKIATNLRDLQKTEIREIQEPFRQGQRGSSAMPHKRNPVGLEACSGLSRVVQSNVEVALRNQVNWHERDISNSSPERVIIPDSSIALDHILDRLNRIIEKMTVFPERMLANLHLTRGLVFSQEVQALVAAGSGLPREEAYELVYRIAQDCWERDLDFRKALLADANIQSNVSMAELEECFSLANKLQHVDFIFVQIFGQEE